MIRSIETYDVTTIRASTPMYLMSRKIKAMGIKMLMTKAPSALIVPITINNSWKLLRYGQFPMGIGAYLKFKVHAPMENKGNADELISRVEEVIVKDII